MYLSEEAEVLEQCEGGEEGDNTAADTGQSLVFTTKNLYLSMVKTVITVALLNNKLRQNSPTLPKTL